MAIFMITGFYLALCSYTDIKYKRINVIFSAIIGLIGLISSICSLFDLNYFHLNIYGIGVNIHGISEHSSFFTLAISLLISIFMLIISVLTKGALGTGDCIMSAVLACFLSPYHLISILIYGFFFSGIVALFLLAKKHSRKDTLCFAPFLLISHICYFLLYTL